MFELTKKYIKDRGRGAVIYTCALTALGANSGCAPYLESYKNFHTQPLETIRDDPLGAAAAIATDIAIILLISQAGGGGGGGGGAAGPGETPGDPD